MLIEQGHKVDVAFNIVQEVNPELKKLGCQIHNIEFQRTPFKKENFLAWKKVKKLVQDEKYELLHLHTPVASFITRLACRNIPNIKKVYTAHGFHFFKGAPLKNWLLFYPMEMIAAKWTDILITMNDEDYLISKKIMGNKKSVFKVHGVGIDLKKFSPQTSEIKDEIRKSYNFKKDDFILIYAGELSYRKHQDLIINALNLLKSKIPNIKLLLAGTGPLLDEYNQRVEQLKLEDNVKFLGYRNDVNKLMLLSDVAVSSSRQEGLPVNVMEAMATGLPLIVTDCRGNHDLVSNEENGFVVGLNDYEQFANAIFKLYMDVNLREKFSEKSLEIVRNYSIEKALDEINSIYFKYDYK